MLDSVVGTPVSLVQQSGLSHEYHVCNIDRQEMKSPQPRQQFVGNYISTQKGVLAMEL